MATKKTKVELSAKTSKYEKSMRNVQRINKKTSQTIIGAWKTASVAVVAATAAMGVGFKLAIDAASDLQEVQGKFDVVFAAHKRQAEDMAKVLVDSYAMSSREAKQYMSNVQDLLVPMGMASAKAILMSNEVVKLSADLGSFNNLPTAKVMEDIQSALVGNFETMKKYGVVLNETVIKQKALEMGLYTGKGMVDANTKAQVAYKLMLEGSAAAIGDQKRTMGSYANQMKLLKAQTENISAAIGDKLLPEVTAWVEQLNIMIGQNPQAIDQIGEFAKNMLDLATAMGKVVGFSAEFSNVWVTTWQAMGLASAGVISWTEALTNATAAVEQFEKVEAGPKFYKVSWPKSKTAPEATPAESPVIMQKENEINSMDAMVAAYYERQQEAELIAMESRAQRMADTAMIEKEYEGQRLQTLADFNTQYADMGKSQFDLERENLQRQAEIWQQYGLDKEKVAQLTADNLARINKSETQQRINNIREVTGSMANGFKMISEMGGKHSKEAFAMYKAFKIIETTISTYSAAIKAYESLVGIPFVGPFIAPAAAAAAVAFGMAQVAMIKNAQPPSYDQGGISNAAGFYQTGPIREAHIPIPSGGKIPVRMDGGGQRPVQIIMHNPVFQDVETQRQVFAQIAAVISRQVAPDAVVENYDNDGIVRQRVRGGA